MNNEIIEILKKYNIHPIKYQKIGKAYIISDKNHSYVIKLNTNNYDIYKYLLSRDFDNFPENLNSKNDNYDISLYIEEVMTKKNQKEEDLIKVLAKLHNKTSYLREIDLDEIKSLYEEIREKILNTKEYYLNLNDYIDKEIFLSPSNYLLVKNISLIYYLLDYSFNSLNKWYQNISKEKNIRVSLLHNNVSLNHFIINDMKYLINWDKACFDCPIEDIYSFYKKYYKDIELSSLFSIYEKINKFNKLEKDFLFIKLAIPKIINFTNNTYQDTQNINDELIYLNKILNEIKKDKSI